jgi:hypothetical protein
LARSAALVLACGCGAGDLDGPIRVDVAGSGGTGSAGTAGAPSAGGMTGGPPGQAASPPLFGDVPAPAMNEPGGCDKVDFLYVVDNSASMVDKQENLARSFLGFSRIVSTTLGTNDHHVMVIDTDANNVGDVLNGYDSNGGGDECVGALGAGRRIGGEGEDCEVDGDQRFLLDEQEDLAGTFACLARVGIFGNVEELAMDAMLRATSAVINDIDDCNAGFLRDDAVLVVTLITDEEDTQSRGDPEYWKRQLLRVKGGNEAALVMLGLIADNHIPGGLPGGPCDEFSGSASPRLEQFVRSFELGAIGSVCAPDYSVFFADAVRSIDTACDEFVPVLR